jgi:hypothetical protein
MIKWLLNKWHARLRRIDIEVLWPICKDKTSSIQEARKVFLFHIFLDNAWRELGGDEIYRIVGGLE